MRKKPQPRPVNVNTDARDAEIEKTTRLRALRLAKEAADKDAVKRGARRGREDEN